MVRIDERYLRSRSLSISTSAVLQVTRSEDLQVSVVIMQMLQFRSKYGDAMLARWLLTIELKKVQEMASMYT